MYRVFNKVKIRFMMISFNCVYKYNVLNLFVLSNSRNSFMMAFTQLNSSIIQLKKRLSRKILFRFK